MKIKSLLFALALMSVAACKDKEEKSPDAGPVAQEAIKENFSVELDVIAEKEDNLAVYFTEDNTINFSGESAVWRGVKGGNAQETLYFELPEAASPTHIRFDFGINKGDKQGDITLKKWRMSYYGNKFEATGADFLKYFIVNDSIKTEVDPATASIKFLKHPNGTSTPFYYPNQALVDAVKQLTTVSQ